jgi:predicted lipoprotein with Yx(FWY)xxD motif
MRAHRRLKGVVAVVAIAAAGAAGYLAAGGSANGATQSKGTVSLQSTKFGKVLVTSSGRTLYLFMKDKSGHSSCSGQCATYWPPLTSASAPTAGTGVKAALLGRVRRDDGKMQVTYNRHPLYLFYKDKSAGQVAGENISAFGGEWYVVNANGVKVEPGEHAGTTSTTSTTSTTTTTRYDTTTTLPGY